MSDSSSHIQTVQSDSPITAADTLPLPRTIEAVATLSTRPRVHATRARAGTLV